MLKKEYTEDKSYDIIISEGTESGVGTLGLAQMAALPCLLDGVPVSKLFPTSYLSHV